MSLPRELARLFKLRVANKVAKKSDVLEFMVGACATVSLLLHESSPTRRGLEMYTQLMVCTRGYSAIEEWANKPDDGTPLHPTWRFRIRDLQSSDPDGSEQQWDFEAPDEATALKFGKALAFDAQWSAEDTTSTIERLRDEAPAP